jgi:tetratricopeptide (TPR) repeat protein
VKDHDFSKLVHSAGNPLEFEMLFYEQLLVRHDDYYEAYFPLAEIYTQLGMYEKGLAIDRRLSELYPDDPSVWYNLACSLSLCMKLVDSLDALETSVKLGFDDPELLRTDPDLANIRSTSRYRRIMYSFYVHE